MTVNQMIMGAVAWGLVTVGAQVLGLDTFAGLAAFIQLTGLVGAPLALVLNRHVRSVPVVIALAIGLSLALTALSAQALIWFSVAGRSLIVATTTVYGVALGVLLDPETDEALDVG